MGAEALARPDLTRLITELSIIQLKGSVRIASFDDDGILNLMRKEGFTTFYSNLDKKVLAAFFKQARRYTGTVLSADGAEVGQRLNLWKGWAISPRRKGKLVADSEHMKVIIANGDQEFFNYLLKWCAWMVQNPGKQAEVAIVVARRQGSRQGRLRLRPPVLLQVGSIQAHPRPEALGRGVQLSLGQLLFALRRRGLLARTKRRRRSAQGPDNGAGHPDRAQGRRPVHGPEQPAHHPSPVTKIG